MTHDGESGAERPVVGLAELAWISEPIIVLDGPPTSAGVT